MTANVDAMVRAGVEAYRAGNKAEARTLLERAIELDQYNETAWLWLSAVVDTQEEQRTCLENVIIINPDNDRARQGLKSLGIDPDTVGAEAEADTFEDAGYSDDWNVPSSSASSTYEAPEVDSSEYDAWMDNLDIGGDSTEENPPAQTSNPTNQADLFSDTDFSAESSFDFGGDDLFGGDDFADDTGFDDSFDDGTFDDFDSGSFDALDETGAFSSVDAGYEDTQFGTEFDDDSFDNVDEGGFDEGGFDDDEFFADDDSFAEFNNAVEGGMFDDDFDADEFAGDALYDDIDTDQDENDPQKLLAMIPQEIKPGRLPGDDEPRPTGMITLNLALVVANVLAILLVIGAFIFA